MRVYNTKKDCCGCMVCVDICPKGAISKKRDFFGFDYPVIDKTLCIQCGACTKVCAFSEKKEPNTFEIRAYAVKNKNSEARMKSSSGGIYTALTDYVIEKGGVVYGAAFVSKSDVAHIRCEDVENRNRTRTSKYVQSDCEGIYNRIKQDLREGKIVLFSGTPCQVGAVKKMFGDCNGNLLLVDIICHGVPSPMLFNKHINYIEKKANKKVKEFVFRTKNGNGRNSDPSIIYEDGTADSESKYIGMFSALFNENKILRESCFNCNYASNTRQGDITIGDFWGVENSMPEFQDGFGVSAVIINSIVGKQLFENIKNDIEYKETSFKEIARKNPNLLKPSKRPKYPTFWIKYIFMGWNGIVESYQKKSLINKIKKRM